MGIIDSIKSRFSHKDDKVAIDDPRHNPYLEHLLLSVPVTIDGNQVTVDVREVKNSDAKVMGGQAVFECRGEKIPVIISSPRADSFSIGINIALHRSLMDDFKAELERLKAAGEVSPAAKLSYNPDTKNAILFRRSNSNVSGSMQRWKDCCTGNMQTLVDDFLACMPFIMGIYDE